ncbi:PREDICTED: neuroligin-4, X-linked-like [Priapulus caudatus]|uniref:Neuroligin-4, X-linked-like n=1 Tax=Priapulus caudatus TaxID=37621 RepID=A0ABM1FA14_PRICU|nr:PREDICTED: neuroligin-4, X-linked-like [Priapulus caudatus]
MPSQFVDAAFNKDLHLPVSDSLLSVRLKCEAEGESNVSVKWENEVRCMRLTPTKSAEHNYAKAGVRGGKATRRRTLSLFSFSSSLSLSSGCLHPATRMPKFPVIMYIHGESYEWNAGNPYDGSVLARVGNVIVITINFRLGILGFLNTGGTDPRHTSSITGNYGLLDQIAALHWIKENIQSFGGDPDNVTIFGHGHGAVCVNLLLLSPVAQGLFRRGIMMSGSALSSWALVEDAATHARYIAEKLGCAKRGSPTIDEQCLRDAPVADVVELVVVPPTFLTAIGPTIDGITVQNWPRDVMRRESVRFGKYDLLFGVTKQEGFDYFNENDTRMGIDERKRRRLLRTFVANLFVYHQDLLYHSIVNEYTDWERAGQFEHPQTVRESVAEVLGDALYTAPLVDTADAHSLVHLDSYFYVFSYQAKRGDYGMDEAGSVRGDDLPYVFGAPLVDGLGPFPGNYSKQEQHLSELMIAYWANFAGTGNPNTPRSYRDTATENAAVEEKQALLEWPQYERVHQRYVNIGMTPRVRNYYKAHKVAFWNKLVPELNQTRGVVNASHHLIAEYYQKSMFEGVVRDINFDIYEPTVAPPTSTQPTRQPVAMTTGSSSSAKKDVAEGPTTTQAKNKTNVAQIQKISRDSESSYSSSLSIVVAVGCSFLILNVLILAGVYYHRDKKRAEEKTDKMKYTLNRGRDDDATCQPHSQYKSTNSSMPHKGLLYPVPPAPPPPHNQRLYSHEATV